MPFLRRPFPVLGCPLRPSGNGTARGRKTKQQWDFRACHYAAVAPLRVAAGVFTTFVCVARAAAAAAPRWSETALVHGGETKNKKKNKNTNKTPSSPPRRTREEKRRMKQCEGETREPWTVCRSDMRVERRRRNCKKKNIFKFDKLLFSSKRMFSAQRRIVQ